MKALTKEDVQTLEGDLTRFENVGAEMEDKKRLGMVSGFKTGLASSMLLRSLFDASKGEPGKGLGWGVSDRLWKAKKAGAERFLQGCGYGGVQHIGYGEVLIYPFWEKTSGLSRIAYKLGFVLGGAPYRGESPERTQAYRYDYEQILNAPRELWDSRIPDVRFKEVVEDRKEAVKQVA